MGAKRGERELAPWYGQDQQFRWSILGLGVLSGVAIFIVGVVFFPNLSVNHDEGVYLNQAELLVHGKLWFTTEIPDVFRPWFFIKDGNRLYPKYSPVAAILFAPGVALGIPRLMLSVIAAGNVMLIGLIGRELFDRTTGVLAATLALAAPMFLFLSATFMAYMPTHLLNLLFAFCYIRTFSGGGYRYAVIAGSAIGLAFFSRPFTAVLFAIPFLIHALVLAGKSFWKHRQVLIRRLPPDTISQLALIALFGGAGLLVSLSYNKSVTGDPLVFPYEVFAPLDGLGFGQRRILTHETLYTVELAVSTNLHLIVELFTRWTVSAPLGSVLAAIGLFPVAQRTRESHTRTRLFRLLVLGVVPSVIVGNVYFWGTKNMLGGVLDPTDGFMSYFGPLYHTDLLLPLSVFGAAGAVWSWRTLRATLASYGERNAVRSVLLSLLVLSVPIVASAEYSRLESPAEKHLDYAEHSNELYLPFESWTPESAFVLLPQMGGGWLTHPFQKLRNGGSLDEGSVLYGLNRGAAGNFAAMDAYPDRTFYRYTYQGDWHDEEKPFIPALQELSIRHGKNAVFETTVGNHEQLESVQLIVGRERIVKNSYLSEPTDTDGTTTVQWAVNGSRVTLLDAGGLEGPPQTTRYNAISGRVDRVIKPESSGSDSLTLNGAERIEISITFTRENGEQATYRYGLELEANGDSFRYIWPGESDLCLGGYYCGFNGRIVPDGSYPEGTNINTTEISIDYSGEK